MIVLPFAAALLLYLTCRRSLRRMEAFVYTSVAWGLVVLVGTELLSLARAITLTGVTTWWLAAVGVWGYSWWARRATLPVADPLTLPPSDRFELEWTAGRFGLGRPGAAVRSR